MSLLIKVGPFGGIGGAVKDMDAYVTSDTRIVKIGIRHGSSIDAVIIYYECNGREKSTDLWGGKRGHLAEIKLQQDEHVTSVRGYIARWENTVQVRSLKLKTSSNKTYGPYGKEEGVPFDLPSFGGRIIGFHARAGSMLEAIGVYVEVSSANYGGSIGAVATGTSTESENNCGDRSDRVGSARGSTSGSGTQRQNNCGDRSGGFGSARGSTTGKGTRSKDNCRDCAGGSGPRKK